MVQTGQLWEYDLNRHEHLPVSQSQNSMRLILVLLSRNRFGIPSYYYSISSISIFLGRYQRPRRIDSDIASTTFYYLSRIFQNPRTDGTDELLVDRRLRESRHIVTHLTERGRGYHFRSEELEV